MSGDFPARDVRLTEAGKRAVRETTQQEVKVWLGKRSRGLETCSICYGYCCGPNTYQGGGPHGSHSRGSRSGGGDREYDPYWGQGYSRPTGGSQYEV